MDTLRVFSIKDGDVGEGAAVSLFHLSGGTTIPSVVVGEAGRGRGQGVLPVANPTVRPTDQGDIYAPLVAASVSTTHSGKPKLVAAQTVSTTAFCIVVFNTPIGFRGGNSHTGDRLSANFELNYHGKYRVGEAISAEGLEQQDRNTKYFNTIGATYTGSEAEELMKEYPSLDEGDFKEVLSFHPFPGQILVEGIIAQGDAGRKGSGAQMVAVMPKGAVFRTGYSGRRYGKPEAHYYLFDGEEILTATWEERELTELF